MKAPSEKHLEDWLFNNFDEFLNYYPAFREDYQIYRQAKSMSGVIDLLIVGESGMIVIELKKDTLDDHALQQVFRYSGDLYDTWHQCVYTIPSKPVATGSRHGDLSLCKILIGYGCKQKTLLAAWGANVSVFNYELDANEYSFEWLFPETKEYNPMEYSEVGDAMVKIARNRLRKNNLLLTQE